MTIADYLTERQVAFEPLPHAPAYSAQQRAKYLRLPGRQVAKAVLLRAPTGLTLAILPATHQIDLQALAAALGGPCRLATDAELVATFHDCEPGVVPPFGTLYGLPTLLEAAIRPETLMAFEAHTTVDAVRITAADFERLERPCRLAFARPAQPASQPRV